MYPSSYRSLSLCCGARLQALLDVQPSQHDVRPLCLAIPQKSCQAHVPIRQRSFARCQNEIPLRPKTSLIGIRFVSGRWPSGRPFTLIPFVRSVPVLGLTISRIFIGLTVALGAIPEKGAHVRLDFIRQNVCTPLLEMTSECCQRKNF